MDAVAWIGLVASWLAVVLILKLLVVALRVLKNIRRLAELSLEAATAMSTNLSAADRFAELDDLSEQLGDAGRALGSATAGLSIVGPGARDNDRAGAS